MTDTASKTETAKRLDKPSFSYRLLRVFVRFVMLVYFRLVPKFNSDIPFDIPIVVAVNHQSYLDPVLVGSSMPRKLRYMARTTLFKNRLFAWLIRKLGAIPIEREGPALAGLKQAVAILETNSALLIFPDSTRTTDGSIGEFQSGFVWLAQKTGAAIVPVVLHGADKALHRKAKFPRPRRVKLTVLDPIPASSLTPREGESASSCRDRLAAEIREMMVAAKAQMERQ